MTLWYIFITIAVLYLMARDWFNTYKVAEIEKKAETIRGYTEEVRDSLNDSLDHLVRVEKCLEKAEKEIEKI